MFLTLLVEHFERISLYQGPKLLKCHTLSWDILMINYCYSFQNRKICQGSNSDPIIGLSSLYILMWTKKRHVDAFQWPFLHSSSIILMLPLFSLLHAVILGLFTNLQKQNKKYIFAIAVQPAKQAKYQLPSSRLKKEKQS